MQINDINIQGVAGIKQLELKFNSGLNLICGTNGIGKTTILDCIATAFLAGDITLKKNAQSEVGKVIVKYNTDKVYSYDVKNFQPNPVNQDRYNGDMQLSKSILYFKPLRDIAYLSLNSISKDPSSINHNPYTYPRSVINGINATDIKNWFINRYMFHDKEGSMTPEQLINFQLATECFSKMDSNINFKTVLSSSYEILLMTNKGDIYFEYLSSGYKSVICILFGIIKEIEYRFNGPFIVANNFEGIILIDEIDVHLHPHWQAKFVQVLKEIFPKAQIIATTHSPNVLQVLDREEIIPLEEDEDKGVRVRELTLGNYGLHGWTLEEILTDVMGLETTSSKKYIDAITSFDQALDREDKEEIVTAYKRLDEMLHPNSNMRRLLKIQMAGLGE